MFTSTPRRRWATVAAAVVSLGAICVLAATPAKAHARQQAPEQEQEPEQAPEQAPDATPSELPVSDAPGKVRWTVNAGLGPTVGFNGTAFGRLIMDGHYRLFGADVGPGIGPMLHVLFGKNRSGLQVGPSFVWELFLADPNNIRLYVGPLVATGYGMERYDNVIVSFRHYWFLTVGAQARAMFNDRIGAFVRPANFDISAGTGGAQGAWSFAAGVSIDF